jgi:hypothetical protein
MCVFSDVTYPVKLSSDDNTTAQWIDGLNALIQLSKVTARVIKFNYCPPPPFVIQGPVKVRELFKLYSLTLIFHCSDIMRF